MKQYYFLFAVAILFASCNKSEPTTFNEIEWLSLEEAQARMAKEPRKIMMDVYTPWCGPCKIMMKTTFKDPEVVNYIGNNYYAVKFNGESGEAVTFKGKEYKNPRFKKNVQPNRRNGVHDLTMNLGVRAYPTLVYFDSKLNKIQESRGMAPANLLLAELKKLNGEKK